MELLKILDLAYQKNFSELIHELEVTFDKTEDKTYLRKADQFVYTQDIGRLLYNELFSLSYRALLNKNEEEYILSLKIVHAKLLSGHRFTYFDRDKIGSLITEIDDQFELNHSEKSSVISNVKAKSIYDRYPIVDIRTLEMEYKKASQTGLYYKNIVELDNYINNGNEDKICYLFLIRYLSGYYLLQRFEWNKDLTYDFIEIYQKLKEITSEDEFSKLLKYLVDSSLKLFIQKEETDLSEIIHYLEQANELSGDDSFINELKAYKKKA